MAATKLNHEIELYDNGTGQLIAWVNVPSLSSSADTILYVYYGNATCQNQENAAGTWDPSYIAVYHMNDTAATCSDSSGNANHGTFYGTDLPTRGKRRVCAGAALQWH